MTKTSDPSPIQVDTTGRIGKQRELRKAKAEEIKKYVDSLTPNNNRERLLAGVKELWLPIVVSGLAAGTQSPNIEGMLGMATLLFGPAYMGKLSVGHYLEQRSKRRKITRNRD